MSVEYKMIDSEQGVVQGVFADTPDKSAEDRFIEFAKRELQEEVDMTEFNVSFVPEVTVLDPDKEEFYGKLPVTSLGYEAYNAYLNGDFEGAFFDGEKYMWQDVWGDEHEGDPEIGPCSLKPIF